jgi:hypothetical protein
MSSRKIIATCVQFLERQGWSLSRIANACGCTTDELDAMKTGKARVRPTLVASLAAFVVTMENEA